MSYTVNFYNFSKRRNSTATPPGSGTQVSVLLKDNTSLYNPVFELSGSNYPSYTYASWQGLYYYVTDIVSTGNNLYEVNCELDAMGSAAGDILSMTAFVNRSASAYELYLKDVEVRAKQRVIRTAIEQTTLGLFDGVGCYILRVIGSNADATGIATYALTEAELNVLLNFMFDDGNFTDVLSDTVIKSIFNPFQYIVSLRYTPIAKSIFDGWGTTGKVNFGWWTGPSQNVRIVDRTGSVYPSSGSPVSLSIPTGYFNDFRDYDPEFTDFKLTLPGGNTVTLPSIWLSLSSIKISVVYDFVVGDSQIFLHSPSGAILSSFSFKCSEEIQIGQQSANMSTIMGDAAGAVGSFMAGNPIGVGVSAFGALSNILQPSPSLLSKNGGMQSMITYRDPVVSITNYESSVIATGTLGRPLNESRTLSTLSGFCKCSAASVDTDLPAQYKDEINGYLNSGFFIE